MGGNTLSTLLAGVGGFLAGGPLGAALAIGSSVYQQQQAAKARSRLNAQLNALREESLGQEVRITGSGQGMDIHYGYTSTAGVQVFAETFSDWTRQTVANEMTLGNLPDGSGMKNEYLLTQSALGISGITGVRGAHIGDVPYTNGAFAGSFLLSVLSNDGTTGVANANATAHSSRRDATARFTGLSYATSVFRLNREDPQYFGVPSVRYYIDGRAVYDPRDTNQSATDRSTWTFSNNPALVLLDYLTDNTYGVGIPRNRIDTDTFISAANRADVVFRANSVVDGMVHSDITPDSMGVRRRDIHRYEFNGSLSTLSTFVDNIETIINVMPGTIFVYGVDGQFKLAVPDITTDNIVHIFDEDDLTSNITTVYPDTNTRLNQATVVFPNASKDFAEDTVTFPPEDSIRHTGYLTEDGNKALVTSSSRFGVSSMYHATYIAAQTIEESRLKTYTWRTRLRGLIYEPGDVVRIQNAHQGIDEVVRIVEVDTTNTLELEFTAVEYNRNIYDATVVADENIGLPGDFDFTVAPPTNVMATLQEAPGIDSALITWTQANDSTVNEYVIEARRTPSETFTEVGRAIGETNFVFSPGAAGVYAFRVASLDHRGRRSAFVDAAPALLNLGDDATLQPIRVIRHHDNLITNDPGAPMGPEGTDTGWYDPVEGSLITTNRPTDPNPHWEAVTDAPAIDAAERIVDFDITGTAGTIASQDTDVQQEIVFALSGEIGDQVQTSAPQREITEFTFSGTSAEVSATPNTPGTEEWDLEFFGHSDDTSTRGRLPTSHYYYPPAMSPGTAYTPTATVNHGSFNVYAHDENIPISDVTGTNLILIHAATSFPADDQGSADDAYNSGIPHRVDIIFDSEDARDAFVNRYGSIDRSVGGDIQISFDQNFDIVLGDTVFTYVHDDRRFSRVTSSVSSDGRFSLLFLSIPAQTPLDNLTYFSAGSRSTILLGEFTLATRASSYSEFAIRFNATNEADFRINIPAGLNRSQIIDRIVDWFDHAESYAFISYTIRQATGGGIQGEWGPLLREPPPISVRRGSAPSGLTGVTAGDPILIIDIGIDRLNIPAPSLVVTEIGTGFSGGVNGVLAAETRGQTFSSIITVNFPAELSIPPVTIDMDGRTTPDEVASDIRTAFNNTGLFSATQSSNNFGGGLRIQSLQAGSLSDPSITFVRTGTTIQPYEFLVINAVEGALQQDTPTSFTILVGGSELSSGTFPSSSNSDAMASQVSALINADARYGSVVSGSVVTATSVSQESVRLDVVIAPGLNRAGGTSANDAAVARVVTQVGSSTSGFIGSATQIQLFIGTTAISTLNLGGQSIDQALSSIVAVYNTDGRYSAVADNAMNTVTLTSSFTGNSPTTTINITQQGTGTDGSTPSTFAITRNVISDGIMTRIVAGQSTILRLIVGTNTTQITIPSGLTGDALATEIFNALLGFTSQYNFVITGSTIRATSLFFGVSPDINIEFVARGRDLMEVDATIDISRSLIQTGSTGIPDLTNVTWEYYVINQEVRVDDDTVMMMTPDNTIASRRGIIEDADVLFGLAPDNSTIAPARDGHQIVTGNRATQFVVSGGWGSLLTLTTGDGSAGDTILVSVRAESSSDGGMTWSEIGRSLRFVLRSQHITAAQNGTSQWITLPIVTVVPATPNTTYDIRCVFIFQDGNNNVLTTIPAASGYVDFQWNALFLEELATTFTDTGEDVATVVSNSQFTVTAPTTLAMGQRIADNGQGNNHVTISNVQVAGGAATVTHGIRGTDSPFTAGESIFRQ